MWTLKRELTIIAYSIGFSESVVCSMRLPAFLKGHRAFLGHVATMMSGKGVASAIALVTMPIIARLFSPADFGVAALFLALGVIISNVGALRYEAAIVLPKQNDEAISLMAFAYRIMLSVCMLLLVLISIYKVSGGTWPFLESLGIWLWLLPAGVLLLTMVQIQENWLGRKKQFKVVATSMVIGTSATGGARIGAGLLSGSTVFGLIVGHMLGQVCRLAVQKSASSEGLRAAFQRMDWSHTRQIATKYADFPKLSAPAALLTALGQQLPVVLFGVLFSPAIVGFYSMATRLTHAPIVIVANSVRRVFLQKSAEIFNKKKSLRKAFLLSTGGLIILGAVPLTVLMFYGQPLTTLLLGERWSGAGGFLEIISLWLFMIWVTAPSNPIFIVLRKQRLWLNMQLISTLARMGTFGLAYVIEADAVWTLWAFVSVTVIGNVMIILVALLLTTQHEHSISTTSR